MLTFSSYRLYWFGDTIRYNNNIRYFFINDNAVYKAICILRAEMDCFVDWQIGKLDQYWLLNQHSQNLTTKYTYRDFDNPQKLQRQIKRMNDQSYQRALNLYV